MDVPQSLRSGVVPSSCATQVILSALVAVAAAAAAAVQAPGDEPVWRQLLRRGLNHADPEVAQQAASALAE
jgi:hypothetical protein